MIRLSLLLFAQVVILSGYAQINPRSARASDSTAFRYSPAAQPHITSENNKVYLSSAASTPLEKIVMEQDAEENQALLRRDTAKLRQLWQRDFTMDVPVHELVTGKSRLPFYASCSRVYENVEQSGGLFFVTGIEFVQELDQRGRMEPSYKRRFSHTWKQTGLGWKLVYKKHEKITAGEEPTAGRFKLKD